jgi:hypothetical protein
MVKYACCYDIDDHCIAGKGRHFQLPEAVMKNQKNFTGIIFAQ